MNKPTVEYKLDSDTFVYTNASGSKSRIIDCDGLFTGLIQGKNRELLQGELESSLTQADITGLFQAASDRLFAINREKFSHERVMTIRLFTDDPKKAQNLTTFNFMGNQGRELLSRGDSELIDMSLEMLRQIRAHERSKVENRLGDDEQRVPNEFRPPRSSGRGSDVPQKSYVHGPLPDDLDDIDTIPPAAPRRPQQVIPSRTAVPVPAAQGERPSATSQFQIKKQMKKDAILDALTPEQRGNTVFASIVVAEGGTAITEYLRGGLVKDFMSQGMQEDFAKRQAARIVTPGAVDTSGGRITESDGHTISPEVRAVLVQAAQLLWDDAASSGRSGFFLKLDSSGSVPGRVNNREEIAGMKDSDLLQYIQFRGNLARDARDTGTGTSPQ